LSLTKGKKGPKRTGFVNKKPKGRMRGWKVSPDSTGDYSRRQRVVVALGKGKGPNLGGNFRTGTPKVTPLGLLGQCHFQAQSTSCPHDCICKKKTTVGKTGKGGLPNCLTSLGRGRRESSKGPKQRGGAKNVGRKMFTQ